MKTIWTFTPPAGWFKEVYVKLDSGEMVKVDFDFHREGKEFCPFCKLDITDYKLKP